MIRLENTIEYKRKKANVEWIVGRIDTHTKLGWLNVIRTNQPKCTLLSIGAFSLYMLLFSLLLAIF